jgi:hypothetical protein
MGNVPAIAVVTQETRLEGLVGRWATKGAARFRLAKAQAHFQAQVGVLGPRRAAAPAPRAKDEEQVLAAAAFEEYESEDAQYRATRESLRKALDLGCPLQFVARDLVANFEFASCAVVVVLGRDGLVANVAKYAGRTPIVGVNPDPRRIDGILVPFSVRRARQAVQSVLEGRAKLQAVTLAEANLNDGQRLLAFNDFFVGCQSHVSARYTLRVGGRAEPQSSSGMIISTGAGSTGWLSSIFNMAEGVAAWIGGKAGARCKLSWGDRRLVWAVREPFRSKSSGASLVAGFLDAGQELIVESLMPARGVIFSDGVEADFLEFNSGTIASFGVSKQQARLAVE